METGKIKQGAKNFFQGFFIISLGIIAGFALVEVFFRQGPVFIILFSIPVAIIIGVPAALISLFLQYLFKVPVNRIFPAVISIIMCMGIVVQGKYTYAPSPETLFTRFVSSQSMQTISAVKGTIEYPTIDHIVRLTFQISPADFALLKEQGDFGVSQDDFAFRVPFVKNYPWWSSQNLKSLQTFARKHSDESQYLWYDSNGNTAWFMSIDT